MNEWLKHLLARPPPTNLLLFGCVLVSLPAFITSMNLENCGVQLNLQLERGTDISFDDDKFWQEFQKHEHRNFVAEISVLDVKFKIQLHRNEHVLEIYKKLEKRNVSSFNKNSNFCYFHGSVIGFKNSHAAINLCSGDINGVISINDNRFVLETSTHSKALYLVPSSQFMSESVSNCDLKNYRNLFAHKNRTKRSVPSYYAQYLDGKERFVELVIVNDYSMYARYKYDVGKLEDRSIQIANIINSLYQPLNIKVGLVAVEVWHDGDKINVSDDGDGTLKAFLHYRKVKLLREIEHDNAQLLSDKVFSAGVVGKALKGTMCSYDMSGGINMDHSRSVVSVASTVAHEMGHNFGMEHDNDSCACPSNRCIMAPSSGGLSPENWSSCSLEYLAWGLEHGLDYCLLTPPDTGTLFKSPTCGNGFVEEGEDCDCGTLTVCDNPCCNATVCKFNEGAVCASGYCCDTKNCKPKPAATVCRSAKNECDLSEYCNGESELCPKDFYKQDGETCSSGYCGNGKCGSRDSQCKLLWGGSGKSSANVCYALNSKGSIYGNCNYDKVYEKYEACNVEDVMCGRLHCEHENERTEYGDKSVVHTAHTFLTLGGKGITACRVAQIDLGLPTDRDPGLVPDGAKCGTDMCVSVSSVLSEMSCSTPDCSGHGVCNSNGQCHCDYGYGGPACSGHGFGGSMDSGPAYSSTGFGPGTAILILFFVLLPVILLGVAIWYRKSKNIWLHQKLLSVFGYHKKSRPSRPAPPPPAPRANGFINPIVHNEPPAVVTSNYKPYANPTLHSLDREKAKNLEITPPLPINPMPTSKPAPYSSQTLPRNVQTWTKPEMTSNFATVARKPSFRPEKAPPPAPDRPERPRESVMERLYAEKGQELGLPSREPSPMDSDRLLPSGKTYCEKGDFMKEVMAEVERNVYDDTPTPQRRAPPPPADPQPGTSSEGGREDQRPSPTPEDPKSDSVRNKMKQWEAKDSSSTVISKPWSCQEHKPVDGPPPPPPKPPSLHRTLSNAVPSDKPAPISLHRSSSSASSRSSGRSQRPAIAPPAPPKTAPKPGKPPIARPEEPPEFDEIDDEENIYDDIMVHSPKPALPIHKPKLTVDEKGKTKISALTQKFGGTGGVSRLL